MTGKFAHTQKAHIYVIGLSIKVCHVKSWPFYPFPTFKYVLKQMQRRREKVQTILALMEENITLSSTNQFTDEKRELSELLSSFESLFSHLYAFSIKFPTLKRFVCKTGQTKI